MIEFYFVGQSFAFHILHFCFCKYQQKLFQQSISLKVSSVFAQIGDLVASSIKRFVGEKDFGSCFPGHGGVLDRFDSVMFSVPFGYYASFISGIWG